VRVLKITTPMVSVFGLQNHGCVLDVAVMGLLVMWKVAFARVVATRQIGLDLIVWTSINGGVLRQEASPLVRAGNGDTHKFHRVS
jgi:hypothetical protein